MLTDQLGVLFYFILGVSLLIFAVLWFLHAASLWRDRHKQAKGDRGVVTIWTYTPLVLLLASLYLSLM